MYYVFKDWQNSQKNILKKVKVIYSKQKIF
jgi:hypothetical protein